MADIDDIKTSFDDYRQTVDTAIADLEGKVQAAGNDPTKLAALKDDIAQAKAAIAAKDPGPQGGTAVPPPTGTGGSTTAPAPGGAPTDIPPPSAPTGTNPTAAPPAPGGGTTPPATNPTAAPAPSDTPPTGA